MSVKSNKTKKPSSKKKATVSVVMPIFNAKNAKAFADTLFSDNGRVISCVKLCDGTLQTKDGKQTVHCAVGEAYVTFINPSLKSVLRTKRSEGATYVAIEALVDAAKLKKPADKYQLNAALDSCVFSNDNDVYYFARAQAVAKTWREEVVPLLK